MPSSPLVKTPVRRDGTSRNRPSFDPVEKGRGEGSPVAASQTRAVPSRLQVASRRPSGLKSTEST